MSELPEGWTICRLKDAIEDIQAGFASGKKDVVRGLPHLRMNNIRVNGKLNMELLRTVPKVLASQNHYLKGGDVLICTTNSGKLVGKCALFDLKGHFAFSNHLTRLRGNPRVVESKYLLHQLWLLWKRGDFEHKCKHWVNQSTLPKEELLSSEILLAPLNEQRRIVAKLEKLLTRLDAAQARLETIPQILKRFRQSVLAAACSGRLTADWRKQNSQSDSSSDITQRVFDFRRATWERIQLHKMRSNGKSPKNQKWKIKYPEPGVARTEDLPELPTQWAWLKLGILGRDPLNTVQTGPFGALLHNSEFTKTGVPVVAVGNLTGMGFSRAGLYFVSKVKAEQLARFDVWAGDVLFARSGATTGKVCVAPPEVKDWRMTGHILRARLNTDVIFPEFMVYALHGSPTVKEQVTGNLRGATRPGFNTSLLEVIDIPVAPLAEQQEIVRRVEALFKTADALEARYRTAKAQVDKLTQSILAKAFRGELVPQDPNDEPASVLLRGIREGGSKQQNTASTGKRKAKTKT